jgi:hypothetical protein
MPPTPQALLWALARAFADGRTVLVVGEPFEAVTLLAEAAVHALVVVSPDADPQAPDGVTGRGAPFRIRPDWRERRGTIGLLLDGEGYVPPEEASRLLGVSGLYLSRTPSPAWEALPERRTLEVVAVTGLAIVGDRPTPATALPLPDDAASSGRLFVGGRRTLPEMPRVVCLDAVSSPNTSAPPATALEPASEQPEPREGAPAFEAPLAARTESVEALGNWRAEARRAALLSERLVDERARFLAEIEALERRMAVVEGPYAELEAAEVARRQVEECLRWVLSGLSSAGLPDLPPPPPATADEAVRLWLAGCLRAITALEAVSGQRAADLREVRAALEAARSAAAHERLAPPVGEARPLVSPDPGSSPGDANARICALEGMLEAMEALRLTDQTALARSHRAAEVARERLEESAQATETARRLAAREALARARLEDDLHVAREAARGHAARAGALEQLVAEHTRMHTLLSEALSSALVERDTAVAERRLADESLRRLRAVAEVP